MYAIDLVPVSDRLADEDLLELDRLVDSHNMERSGIEDARLISIMIRSTTGELIAGLHGYTWGGYCEVKSLFVAADLRGQGLGGTLLASAEKEASCRGCRLVLLTTHSFQAPGFYRKHGYGEVVRVHDCPQGHSYILMSKRLDGPSPANAIPRRCSLEPADGTVKANLVKGFQLIAPLPMRLVIGYGFLAHGLAKLERGPEHFVMILQTLGIPAAEPMAWLTIVLEVICGISMLAGFLVPLITLPMLAILVVALVTVHAQFGFSSIKLLDVGPSGPRFGPPGMETDLLYVAGLAALVLGAPGPLALDNWLRRRSSPQS